MTDSGDSNSACKDAIKGAAELWQAEPSRGPKDLSSLASRGYTAKPDRASSQEKVWALSHMLASFEILSDCAGSAMPCPGRCPLAGMRIEVMQQNPLHEDLLDCTLTQIFREPVCVMV